MAVNNSRECFTHLRRKKGDLDFWESKIVMLELWIILE